MIFSEEQSAMREAVRRLFRERLLRDYRARERSGRLDRALVLEMGAIGLIGVDLPQQYGGMGMECLTTGLIIEERAYWDFHGPAAPTVDARRDGPRNRQRSRANHEADRRARARRQGGRAVWQIAMTDLGSEGRWQSV